MHYKLKKIIVSYEMHVSIRPIPNSRFINWGLRPIVVFVFTESIIMLCLNYYGKDVKLQHTF